MMYISMEDRTSLHIK